LVAVCRRHKLSILFRKCRICKEVSNKNKIIAFLHDVKQCLTHLQLLEITLTITTHIETMRHQNTATGYALIASHADSSCSICEPMAAFSMRALDGFSGASTWLA